MSGGIFGTITIPTPHVPYGPVGIPAPLADAKYLREAAKHIEQGYRIGGSNLTATVLKLLRDAADAIEATNQQVPEHTVTCSCADCGNSWPDLKPQVGGAK